MVPEIGGVGSDNREVWVANLVHIVEERVGHPSEGLAVASYENRARVDLILRLRLQLKYVPRLKAVDHRGSSGNVSNAVDKEHAAG